ncbi:MAG: translocation/assembly module TamB domain-containing protein, partial [Deltaproteobacteria bacterium]|nr:translocation/assembly module TamB domain-containing protein [Deltaproteobacteria bacterium]
SLVSRNALLDPFLPLVTDQLRGENARLNADFHARGDVAAPEYSGFVRLAASQLTLPLLGTSYDDVSAALTGDHRRITLDRLHAKSGDGSLDGNGALQLTPEEAARAFRFQARFEKFAALDSESARVQTTGKLELTADRRDSVFHGALEIAEGKLDFPDTTGKKTVEPLGELEDVKVAAQKKPQGPGLLEGLHGSIKVNAPGRFWVGTADKSIAVELAAALEVGLDQDDGEPFITGKVNARRGDVELLGRRFEAQPSVVEFTGDPKEPHVSANAMYRASPWSIKVAIDGEPARLRPRLSSEPAGLSQEQCMGVLLTGDPGFRGQGGGNRSAASMATGVASGFLVGKLKKELGPALPIDTLTADIATDRPSGSAGGSETAAPAGAASNDDSDQGRSKVEVGKYVSDRIFVKLGRVFSTEDQAAIDRLTVDYRLSDRWSIVTSQTDQGRSDLEVLWTLNY